jgi:hypothetical protein
MPSFSQRKGLEPVSKIIQVDSMDESLRISIWNTLDRLIWSRGGFLDERTMYKVHMQSISRPLWADFWGLRLDSLPTRMVERMKFIEKWFFEAPWNKIYDFLEFIVKPEILRTFDISVPLNVALEKGGSAYRIVGGIVTDIVSENEVEMLQQTFEDESVRSVSAHLKRALQLLADRDHPDYRNSIKESISAVESMAKIVANDPKATLSAALKALEKDGRMHTALKDGFLKLYGYTNDEDGIRHAMLEEPKLTSADAKYFLMSCTSFANYLKAQLPAN